MNILTAKLRDGRVVVAKNVKGWDEPYPTGYANLTQAYRKSGELNEAGIKAFVTGNRPYYVTIEKGEAS